MHHLRHRSWRCFIAGDMQMQRLAAEGQVLDNAYRCDSSAMRDEEKHSRRWFIMRHPGW